MPEKYGYGYGKDDGLGMPSITKKFGVRQDGTFGEITTNQFDGTTDEFSQSNAASSVLKSPSADSTIDKKELGLFDMNDRGLTRFGSYADTAATGIGAIAGLGTMYTGMKAQKLNEKIQLAANDRAEKKQDIEIDETNRHNANMKEFARNANGTY